MTSSANEIVLEARSITKRYPGTIALDDVTFRVHRNQVNVLIGENGAGKSTLMRILAGVKRPRQACFCLKEIPSGCARRARPQTWESALCTRSFPFYPIST